MLPQILVGIGIALFSGSVVYALYNWDRIATRVRAWLAQRNLNSRMLSGAFVLIDRLMVGARRVLRITSKVQRHGHAQETVTEEEVNEGSEEYRQIMEEYNAGVRRKDLMQMLG